ncbi:MAG: GTP-binding protein LepA, GTP-binding protein LepA [Candidatus Parcubacteria bacterium]|jgi:GTP-binding protein LepA
MNPQFIRNFSIIAHIDHGKSTLADRMLEVTNTIEKRKMQEQVLDSMELERERGITIKMQPVRMRFRIADGGNSATGQQAGGKGQEYILNLIDTPGHIDFSYEVSRALKAVEGSILLVDATQGVQAQTLTTLNMARESGLTIIPVVSKIDSPLARVPEVVREIAELLGCDESTVLKVSGKTGEGVPELLAEVIARVPAPSATVLDANSKNSDNSLQPADSTFRSLVFDFQYSNHKGVIVYVRVMSGSVKRQDQLMFKVSDEKFQSLEVGIFAPDDTPTETLSAGEIGYIVTGIKQPGIASVGDTVASIRDTLPPLAGYMSPRPVVWASVYPESQDDFNALRMALGRLRLSDSSFTHDEESSGTLGRGFRCGFLGMLHLEIITERLRREFNLNLVVTIPSITYEVELVSGKRVVVYSPALFPDDHEVKKVFEPLVNMKIITPPQYLGVIMQAVFDHEGEVTATENFGDNRTTLSLIMPLRELMRNFFDEMKSISSGFASISYEIAESREADVARLDILVADEPVVAFTRVVSRRRLEEEAKATVEKLAKILPRQMFTVKIQGKALGRIISSETLSGMQKNVTQHMYGGDRTRKMKLWEKQKEGKKKMKELGRGNVNIPQDVFVKMMRSE